MSWAAWLTIGIAVWFLVACWLSYAFTRTLAHETPLFDAALAEVEQLADTL